MGGGRGSFLGLGNYESGWVNKWHDHMVQCIYANYPSVQTNLGKITRTPSGG